MTDKTVEVDETPKDRVKIDKVYVTWKGGTTSTYTDVVAFESDTGLGIPRLSILDSKGAIENINLNYVESWTVHTKAVH